MALKAPGWLQSTGTNPILQPPHFDRCNSTGKLSRDNGGGHLLAIPRGPDARYSYSASAGVLRTDRYGKGFLQFLLSCHLVKINYLQNGILTKAGYRTGRKGLSNLLLYNFGCLCRLNI